jgi:hypothetical protein
VGPRSQCRTPARDEVPVHHDGRAPFAARHRWWSLAQPRWIWMRREAASAEGLGIRISRTPSL